MMLLLFSLRNSQVDPGRYTAEQVARCAEMSGPFGKAFEQLFLSSGIGQFASSHSNNSPCIKSDIVTFVEEYREDALFSFIPGRHHKGYDTFTYPGAPRYYEIPLFRTLTSILRNSGVSKCYISPAFPKWKRTRFPNIDFHYSKWGCLLFFYSTPLFRI